MSRVFISHASPDRKAADRLCRLLEDRGIPCWIAPRDVRPGREYAVEIVHGIDQCTAVVLVLSTDANESNYVKREVECAVSRRKPVFPVRIREVEVRGAQIGWDFSHRPIYGPNRIEVQTYREWIPRRRIVKRVWVPRRTYVRHHGHISIGGRLRIR